MRSRSPRRRLHQPERRPCGLERCSLVWRIDECLHRIACPGAQASLDYTPGARQPAGSHGLPGACLLVTSDAAHSTSIDQRQRFNRSLLAFLQEVENTAATSPKD